jgi:hypothetical protein
MGYRELHRMEIEEVVRRWQVNESQRAIARATGLARETVKKYVAAAGDLGLSATGPPPTERELVELRRLGVVATQPIVRVAPQAPTLEPYRDQIATWIDDDHLLLNRRHRRKVAALPQPGHQLPVLRGHRWDKPVVLKWRTVMCSAS